MTLLCFLGAVGCERSCKNDHPYVPYTVGETPSTGALDGGVEPEREVPVAEDAGLRSLVEPPLIAPRGATTWELDGRSLVAPAGTEFAYALARDFDDDGASDVLAIVRAVASTSDASPFRASVVHYAGGRPDPAPAKVLDLPAVAVAPSCEPVLGLSRIGAHSATVEVGTTCTAREGTRSVYVVRLAKEPSVAFDLGLRDPEAAARVSVVLDGADRDRDGIDDVTVRFTVEESAPPFEPAPAVSASVTFFDRPAGASRSPEEPEASFRAISSRAALRAVRTKDAPSVPALVRQLRVLHRAICADSGAARWTKRGTDRGVISCGASKALEDASVAEVRAYVTQKDALRAVLAAPRAQGFPATTTKAKTTELSSMLDAIAPTITANEVRLLDVPVSLSKGPHPSWGALAFEASGRLLVRGDDVVRRVDPSTDERETTDVPLWELPVLSPDSKSRWLEVYHPCGAASLRATLSPTGGDGDVRDVPLPVLAPFATRCEDRRSSSLRTLPVAWDARGLEALADGQLLLIEGLSEPSGPRVLVLPEQVAKAPVVLGAPRSPGGKSLVVPVADAVFVKSERGSFRLRAAGLEPYARLRSCVASDDGTRLACERDGRVLVATFGTAPSSP